MPANQRKVVDIILQEVRSLDERCEGYHDMLTDTVVEILAAENQHRVRGTNIQQQIAEKGNAAGSFLAARKKGAPTHEATTR